MAQTSGFFDALETSAGAFDRTYSSGDFCDNLATIINDGVRYSTDNDLAVSALSSGGSMGLSVAIGRAWIKGHYFYNNSAYTDLTVATAPTGTYSRIDNVVLRLDTSEETRAIYLDIVTGTAAASPTAPALTRSGDIYELCLARITVTAGITAITDSMITDTREDTALCGWASSVTPAIMSLLRQYVWTDTLTAAAQTVTFSIPQYDATAPMIVNVFTNGVREIAGVDYTITGSTITFSQPRTAGTEIAVVVLKSIDGSGLGDVSDEIAQLQTQVANLENDAEYIYECNGATDNIELSNLAQSWLATTTDYATLKIRVVGGNIGVTAAHSGAGTAARPYKWFNLGLTASTNRRVIIDFSNAGQITVPIAAGTYNDVFCGYDVNIIGADVVANQTGANTNIDMFSSSKGAVYAENCRFWINASLLSYIANNGTFVHCRGSVTVTGANAYCFYPQAGAIVRIQGGEYYAYTGSTSYLSAVLYVVDSGAVGITYAISCPTVSRAGYYQTYAIYATAGKVSITDTITALTVNANIANVRGTLAVSISGTM